MKSVKISKNAFSGLLHLQQVDEAARQAAPKPSKIRSKRAAAVVQSTTADLASVLAGATLADKALPGTVTGGLRTNKYEAIPFDFERKTHVEHAVPLSALFYSSAALKESFNCIAPEQGVPVSFRFHEALNVDSLSAKHSGVIGYMYPAEQVPESVLHDCLRMGAKGLKNKRDAWNGDYAKKPDELPAHLDNFYEGTPGINIKNRGVLLRAPLAKPGG